MEVLESQPPAPASAVEQAHKRKLSFKKLISYYPVRYHICAFAIAYLFLTNVPFINRIEQAGIETLTWLTNAFVSGVLTPLYNSVAQSNITPQFVDSEAENVMGRSNTSFVPLLLYLQLPYLIFFPTVAFTARIGLLKRLKFLGFGALCFGFFVFVQFSVATIGTMIGLDPISFYRSFVTGSGFATVISGALFIEMALFSSTTKPERTKITPIVKRTYRKHYTYLMILIGSAFLTVFILAEISTIFKESPIALFAAIHLANIRTVAVFGSYISFILYNLDQPEWIRTRKGAVLTKGSSAGGALRTRNDRQSEVIEEYSPRISFLVPAANEERLIGRCIKSIDEACYNYPIRNEIIVVNDGSTDRTEEVAQRAISNLKYCTGHVHTIANSGKGTALQYGLGKTTGEIVYRIDGDSEIDREAVRPLIRHFQDPQVGSAGGMIIPLDRNSVWQKMVTLAYVMFNNVNKRTQGAADSILIQSGAYSAFRRDALVKIGGWTTNQFGEDGEITNRMARYGYKLVFEPDSIVYGDIPDKLQGIMSQRARWSIAYYHARGRNLDLATDIRQYKRPRSVFFLLNILSHGGGIVHGLMWSILAAAVLAGYFHPAILVSHAPALLLIPYEVMIVPIVVASLALILLLYWLKKYFGHIGLVKYFPMMWVYSPINTMLVIVTAMETILAWSSRWKTYSTEAYQDLRREMKANVDPLHG